MCDLGPVGLTKPPNLKSLWQEQGMTMSCRCNLRLFPTLECTSVRVTKRPQGYVCGSVWGSELTNIRYAGCTIHGGKEMGSKLLTLLWFFLGITLMVSIPFISRLNPKAGPGSQQIMQLLKATHIALHPPPTSASALPIMFVCLYSQTSLMATITSLNLFLKHNMFRHQALITCKRQLEKLCFQL